MMFNWFRKNKAQAIQPISSPRATVGCPILSVLDQCAESFKLPMLDNGYVYLAATRLTLFKNEDKWAFVFEVFGHMPRAWAPDTSITTFSNALSNRQSRFVDEVAYNNYLKNNPHNASKNYGPIKRDEWPDCDYFDFTKNEKLTLRGNPISLPTNEDLLEAGIIQEEERLQTFEFCRYLAHKYRELVLATPQEKRYNLSEGMKEILVLDDWHHPDLVSGERPSDSQTFQMLRDVLLTGDVSLYRPSLPGNTHWKNWPDSGRM